MKRQECHEDATKLENPRSKVKARSYTFEIPIFNVCLWKAFREDAKLKEGAFMNTTYEKLRE
jgi:hypothetical protein